ncbi:MAG: hypothetical protein KDA41_08480, partial [Planctomycetales bacterium]|nr:hypothetical protein [Planctomycetales bacterium]
MRWMATLLLVVLSAVTAIDSAWGIDTDDLRRKQQSQERARAMARDLVTGILDIQLRQLEENGLRELPVYGEIRLMRDNIDTVAHDRMNGVVRAIVEAQEATDPDDRLRRFNIARDEIRVVVRELVAERQKLLRRLQIARVATQVRELIRREELILGSSKGVAGLPQAEADRATLVAQQDQRDMRLLFLELVDSLVDMKDWGGQLAAAAGDGLKILQAGQVGAEVDNAVD